MMDLKSKSVSWFGNICQKFETMCHEVDNIVSQETVKCVGNQMQSVSESMKRFYADVIQDIVPHPIDPLPCESITGAVSKNAAATGTFSKTMMGIEKCRGCTSTMIQSSEVLNDSAPSTDQSNSALGGSYHVNQLISTISREQVVQKESYSAPKTFGNVLEKEDLFTNREHIDIKNESSASDLLKLNTSDGRESFEASFSSEHITFGVKNASAHPNEDFPASSPVDCRDFQSLHKVYENRAAQEDPFTSEDRDDIMSMSCAEVLELSTLDGRESLQGSISSEPIDCDHENSTAIIDKDSQENSVNGEEFQPLQKAGRVCDGLLDDFNHVSESLNGDCMSEMASLVASSDERSKEMDFPSSTSYVLAALNCSLHNSDNSIPNEDVTYGNPTTDFFSSASLLTESFMSKVTGKKLVSSYSTMSLESLGYSGSGIYITDDLNGTKMETIDLSDKAKLEDSCFIVDDNMLHEVSRRTRKLRSYKDIFAPKKMLAKEYERLAIWYGDCDMGSRQDMVMTRSLSATTFTSDNLQIQQTPDSEWELL